MITASKLLSHALKANIHSHCLILLFGLLSHLVNQAARKEVWIYVMKLIIQTKFSFGMILPTTMYGTVERKIQIALQLLCATTLLFEVTNSCLTPQISRYNAVVSAGTDNCGHLLLDLI